MKKIFIVFILLSFTFGINANTKKKIIEDCNYLEQILTQAYVNYDEAASKGFNIDLLTKNIKLNYKNSFGYKKELDEENLGLLIALHTTDYLKSLIIWYLKIQNSNVLFLKKHVHIIQKYILKKKI